MYGAILARHLVAIHHADQAGDLALAGAEADAIATMDDHGDLYQLRTATARGDLVSAGGNAGAIPPDLHAIEARLATVLAEPPAWHRTSRLSLIGSLASDLGLRDLGGEIARALGPYADELIAPGTALVCAGPAALVLARLDALDGRADDAIDRLRAALDRAIATGLRGWEAPILVELADRLRTTSGARGPRRPVPRSSSTGVVRAAWVSASRAAVPRGARPRLVWTMTPVALMTRGRGGAA